MSHPIQIQTLMRTSNTRSWPSRMSSMLYSEPLNQGACQRSKSMKTSIEYSMTLFSKSLMQKVHILKTAQRWLRGMASVDRQRLWTDKKHSQLTHACQVGKWWWSEFCVCCTSVIMTLWPIHILIHDVTPEYPKLAESRRPSICNVFSWNTSHSHDNLRRVSKSPLLHPFTCCRSNTLDWCGTRATSSDSSRLTHSILAHSSTLRQHYLSIFHRHRISWIQAPSFQPSPWTSAFRSPISPSTSLLRPSTPLPLLLMTPSPRSSQFSRMDPSKSLSSGALTLMSSHSSTTSMLPTSLPMFYSSSVEMSRTSGSTPAMRLCPTMKILPKLTSTQCGLPSSSIMEPLTKLPKNYETFYERPRNQPIWNSMTLKRDSISLTSTYLYSGDPMAVA